MNQITDKVNTGTIGELLVQARLLQYGVQAAPPIKDSGNDLIAVKGATFRAVSVRSTVNYSYKKPRGQALYHVLAVVKLVFVGREVLLDRSRVFLISRDEVESAPSSCRKLDEYLISEERVTQLFGQSC